MMTRYSWTKLMNFPFKIFINKDNDYIYIIKRKTMSTLRMMMPTLENFWILALNRNARAPKRANHGARPCSSVVRRVKKEGNYRKPSRNIPFELEEVKASWKDI